MNLKKSGLTKILFISLILAILLLAACESENAEGDIPTFKVLFQYEYINWAWVYSHGGWFIDNNGNVKEYNLPNSWKKVDSMGYISYDSLIFNYMQADTLLKQIDTDKLLEKSALIKHTINGELSELECHGADIGSMSYYCYYWDDEKKLYKRELLKQSGDCAQSNNAAEAIMLAEYLQNISVELR